METRIKTANFEKLQDKSDVQPQSHSSSSQNLFSVSALKFIKKHYKLKSNSKLASVHTEDDKPKIQEYLINSKSKQNVRFELSANNTTKENKTKEETDSDSETTPKRVNKTIFPEKDKNLQILNTLRETNNSTLYPSLNRLRPQNKKSLNNLKNNLELNENTIRMLEKEKIEMNEKQDEIFNNERNLNQVIKLNHWEYENLKYKESNKNLLSTYEGLEIDSLNYLNHMKESFAKLNLRNISDQLLEFYIKCEEEQGSMLLQSVNINKSKFDYEVFLSGKDKKNTNKILNYFLELNKTKDRKKFLTGDQDENIQKIKEYEKKGVLDIIGKADFYREIIKEKLKIEEIYHNELVKIADLIFKKKNEIKTLTNLSRDITNYLKNLNIEHENKKEELEKQINATQLSYNQSFMRSGSILGSLFNNLRESEPQNYFSNNNNNNTVTKSRAEQRQFIITLQKEVTDLESKFKSSHTKYTKSLQEKKENLEAAKNEVKRLKSIYHYLCKDQKIYYCGILKLGIDVRAEGLCWVVKKLIELNTHMEYSMFPHFLNNSHIDYLIKFSYKTVELNLLKLAGKTYRMKKDKLRNEKAENKPLSTQEQIPLNTNTSYTNSMRPTKFWQQNPHKQYMSITMSNLAYKNENETNSANTIQYNLTDANFTKTNKSNMFASSLSLNLEKFFNNDNYLMQTYYTEKIEEESVDNIVRILKKRIKNLDDNILDKDELTVFSSFNNQLLQNKDEIEEIKILRDRIDKLNSELVKIKDEEMKKFRRQYEKYKNNTKHSISADIIFCALFGNNITI